MLVVVDAPDGDLLTEVRVSAIGRLADALRSVAGVRRVTSIATIRVRPPDRPEVEPKPLWTLPAFNDAGPVTRADVLGELPFVPLLLSTDARTSAIAVEPSYIDAFATSIPVSWQISVWNSKMYCSVPCDISG